MQEYEAQEFIFFDIDTHVFCNGFVTADGVAVCSDSGKAQQEHHKAERRDCDNEIPRRMVKRKYTVAGKLAREAGLVKAYHVVRHAFKNEHEADSYNHGRNAELRIEEAVKSSDKHTAEQTAAYKADIAHAS